MFELIALGGTDEEGNDLTNEMSYMCLDALAHVGMPMPSVGSRIGNQTPDEFLYRNIEVIRLGYGMPNLFNDEVIIPAMVNRGIPLRVAPTTPPAAWSPILRTSTTAGMTPARSTWQRLWISR